ncbi:S41 family peptidase [Candidatus Saganbacteria bacterium]|uniref:S41 family peptidase n=1 Tax=Candidatus Saganbacteria bacterium TaxID=2575572 RepID=A0A9D6ULP2_UNCSA|nr:S41 family peptidase [Candidatus Saganbacteria bacterium]
MKKIRHLVVGAVIIAMIYTAGFSIGKGRAAEDLDTKLETFLDVLGLIKTKYVEKDIDNSKLVYGAIKGALESLDDPYSRFLEPKAYSEMRVRLKGTYSGIGIYIGMKDKMLTVISPIPGTPADKEGLKAKDKIVEIEGKNTKDMALEEAVSMIRGKAGTKVKLGIMRPGFKEPKIFNVSREKIEIKSTSFKMLEENIAYIKLNTFEKQSAPAEFKNALNAAKKKKARGLIIDLRGNGGGLLDNAIQIGSMFIKSGIIVMTVDREGSKEIKYSSGDVQWTSPTVVLVDESSASASEILAGALQDNKTATIVGTKSFGKASVQSVRVLSDDSAVLLTIAKYQTPNGTDISKKGIQPDVFVAEPTEEAIALKSEPVKPEKTEGDTQLTKAIEVLKAKL